MARPTLLQIAASAWGCGSDPGRDSKSFVQRWLQTLNALEALAACHSDMLVCLDELGTITGDLGQAIYMLSGGSGKGSMDSHRNLTKRRVWHVIVLSSGEKTVTEVIEDGGKQVKAGHIVRLIDIPAVGIFTSLDGGNIAEVVNNIKDRCARFYGVAGPEMVKCLISAIRVNPDQVLDGLRAEFNAAVRALTPGTVTPEQGPCHSAIRGGTGRWHDGRQMRHSAIQSGGNHGLRAYRTGHVSQLFSEPPGQPSRAGQASELFAQ